MKRDEKTESGWQQFLQICAGLKSAEQLETFFGLMMTFDERNDFAKRLLIIQELLKGEKPQREIAEALNVSISKITRGSNSVKMLDNALEKMLIKYLVKK